MDYSNGKIYRIIIGDLYYIGSTTMELNKRLQSHRYTSKKHPNMRLYKSVVDWKDVSIELVEDYPCASKIELLQRENTHIKLDDEKCLNSRPSYQTIEEAKQKEREHNKKYKTEHKEQIKEQRKKYRQNRVLTDEEIEKKREYMREYMRNRRQDKSYKY